MRKIPIILLVLMPYLANAWGEEGHRIAGAIAEQYLSYETKSKIEKLTGPYSIEDLGNWLDWKRGYSAGKKWYYASPFHYVSIPYKENKYDREQHCGEGKTEGICLESMIAKYEARVKNLNESPETRAEALKVLIHLIEDLHQPLHTGGKAGDRGGNGVEVKFFTRETNLHKVYDSELIWHSKKSEEQWVVDLTRDISRSDVEEIQKGAVIDWINESHSYVGEIYKNLPDKVGDKIIVTQKYVSNATPLIEQQMLSAGLRLAKYLTDLMAEV